MPRMRPLAYTLTIGSLLAAFSSASDSPTVTVKNGSYYGVYQDTYDQDLFLGMPYAQPPVGDLRFRNPEPLNSTWSDSKNATEYSPECYGYGSDQWVLGNVISEDCLTINVVRPSGVAEDAKLPVGFWIHGGGYYEGGNRDPRYNFSSIINEATQAGKPFIGVSINYRLDGFGFMWGSAVKEAGVANLGLKDQRLALHWVQENIAAFGGDPDKVTIWGESAGAGSVGSQLVAFGGRDDGLFRGGILQSGAPASALSSYTNASTFDVYYKNITDATNCSSVTDTLDCLRQVPVSELSAIFNSSVSSSAPFSPTVDGDFIPEATAVLLSEGKFVHVPVLLGANHDEGTAFGSRGVNTTEQFLAYLFSRTSREESAAALADLYPDIPEIGIPGTLHGHPGNDTAYGAMYKRVCAYAGDRSMHAPRRYAAEAWAANNVTSYSYVFNVLVNGLTQYTGATHFQEVAFVFYNLDGNGYENAVSVNPFKSEPETFSQLARMMTRMWTSFIVDQTPNNNGVANVTWPEYTLDNPQNIVFDVNVTDLAYIEPDIYRAEAIAFINNALTATD
ncbi:Lipase 1 [Phytophthora ramorum]|uniref:Lipase 1 n=1 Tax=Phytophthora ramorum TaxID=164328 RepID=UPI00309A6CC8|nr:Lipase 1 [Phytophthora ramorum]